MHQLTAFQFQLVSNILSMAIATLGAAAIFFFMKSGISRKYQLGVIVSGVVCSIATYHYSRIYESFNHAYALQNAGGVISYVATGAPFNDFYRYADWFITVPLLMVELVAVLALPSAKSRSLLKRLVVATALMIALGYPGEASTNTMTRWIFWALSMVPFCYTLYVLFVQLSEAIEQQPKEVRGLIVAARAVTLVTWLFYPAAYAIKTLFSTEAFGEVVIQIGYSFADITAKAGYGLVIYLIARGKSELESAETGEPHANNPSVSSLSLSH